MAYRKMTADEKKAYTEKNVAMGKEILARGIRNIKESYGYRRFLETAAMFHKYSFRNMLMIMEQAPNVTKVAGFGTWKKMGRSVKKGEKSIKIWAPNMKKVKDEETGEEEMKLTGFRLESVFDISQTTGEDLPSAVYELKADAENGESLMKALIKGAGVTYSESETIEGRSDAYGVCYPKEKRIVVKSGVAQAQKLRTLAHEIAHAALHAGDDKISTECMEVQAESVAFIVCRHFGIDTGDYSFGYIAEWASNMDDSEIETILNGIVKTAAGIIENTEAAA